jgi:anti-anti-sigma factor
MAATEFGAEVRHEGGGAVLDLTGNVSAGAEQKLLEVYAKTSGKPVVILDFSNVDYINSTGIALIVGILARARAQSQPVSAAGLTEHYREIFEITRLSDFMTILADGPSPAAEHGGTR